MFATAAVLSGALWSGACGDGGTEPPPDPSRPTTVTVTPATPRLTALEETVRLAAVVHDQYGRVMTEVSVAWTTADAAVAEVDASGLVTAAGNGEATVTATAGAASGTVEVTVAQEVAEVVVTPAAETMLAFGDTVRLAAEAQDANGNAVAGAEFTWTSGNPAVAQVDGFGLVTAVGNGEAAVSAATGRVSGRAEVTVEQEVAEVAVTSRATTPLAPGDTVRLSAEALDANGNAVEGAGFTWTSSDPAVASVDSAGLVTAVGGGEVTVTAQTGGVAGSVQLSVGDPEYWVLWAFAYSTGIDAWTNSDGWFESLSLGDWYGVDVDSIGRVLGLRLSGNNLSGRIPPELGDLVHLEDLDLSGNELRGAIPRELGELANLTHLNLSGNELSGPIPPELGGLPRLERLYLATNDLDGPIPPELGGVAPLEELRLQNNDLSGPIPAELGNLTNLEVMELRSNSLTGVIPRELGGLANLERLNLSDNELGGPIPEALGNLAGLEFLWLSHNEIDGPIPSELGELAELEVLWVSHNALSGPVPAELGEAANLDVLLVGGNPLSGPLPVTLTGLSLSSLGYAGTDLCVPVDPSFREWLAGIPHHAGNGIDCPSDRDILAILYHATDGDNWANNDNWLTDADIGEWVGVNADDAGRVVGLNLNSNGLSGPIPAELGNLSNIGYLFLSGNTLSGAIPSELGALGDLESLDFRLNELTGPIPPELGDLAKLEILRLTGNELAGPLPPELGDLTSLRWLELGSNRITGPIPPELGSLAGLEILNLSENNLSGPIPPELGQLVNLKQLLLYDNAGGDHDNELTGPIPAELGGLDSLEILSLSGNALTGPIPAELGSLSRLYWLSFASNDLTGPIPPELGNLGNLGSLDLSGNSLTGPIPPELGDLVNLTHLTLQANSLSGPIPPELGLLANLEIAKLNRNDLTGSLPSELGELSELRWLWLQSNAGLEGALPLSLAGIALEHLIYYGTALCVPGDEAFRQWLAGIQRHEGTGVECASDRDILESLYDATDGPNWDNDENWLTDEPIGEWFGVEADSSGRVTRLALPANGLTGRLPGELGGLEALEVLSLRENDLTGPIPPEIGDLPILWGLALHGNNLTGTIPPEVGNLDSLEFLRLHENDSLTGPLPLSLSNLPLRAFWYSDTDLCVPDDAAFREWLAGIDSHQGTGVDCGAHFRLEFDSLAEVEDWSLSTFATADVSAEGVLWIGSSVTGRSGAIWNLEVFDSAVTDWVGRARMGRSGTDARMALWFQTTHARYQTMALDLGSGVELGPDTARVDTNWRIFFFDADRDGSGEGGWVYFRDYGYGTSDAISDGAGEFTDMSFAVTEDSVWVHADGTPVFADELPAPIAEAGATNMRGVWLAYHPIGDEAEEFALFDWLEITGKPVGGADAQAARIDGSVEEKVRAKPGDVRSVGRWRRGR